VNALQLVSISKPYKGFLWLYENYKKIKCFLENYRYFYGEHYGSVVKEYTVSTHATAVSTYSRTLVSEKLEATTESFHSAPELKINIQTGQPGWWKRMGIQ